MKVGAIVRCYHLTHYLEAVLKSYAWVNRIVVLNYRFKSVEPKPDNTKEIALSLGLKNIEVDSGEGLEQHEIVNRGINTLLECDYVFIADADELITPKDQQEILSRMVKANGNFGNCAMIDYLYDYYHRWFRKGSVLAIVKPQKLRLFKIRQHTLRDGLVDMPDIFIHHFGAVFPIETMRWKYKWESIEEKDDVEKNFRNTVACPCVPPKEILEMLGEK